MYAQYKLKLESEASKVSINPIPCSGCWSEAADSGGRRGAEHDQGGETPEADLRAQCEALHGQCQV